MKEGRPQDIEFINSISEQEIVMSPKTEEAESKADVPKDQEHAKDTSSENNVTLDRSRQMGDWLVYWFYIKSMDYRFAVAFFVLFTVETFFEKFPRMSTIHWGSSVFKGISLTRSLCSRGLVEPIRNLRKPSSGKISVDVFRRICCLCSSWPFHARSDNLVLASIGL